MGARDGADGLWLGRAVTTPPSPAVNPPATGSQMPSSSSSSDGCPLGACDGRKVGAAVFPQQPKNMIAPLYGDTPGQH